MSAASLLHIATLCLLVLTALTHSILGERLLIGPMLRRRRDPATDNDLGRIVLRLGWHMMSIAFGVLAAALWQLGPVKGTAFLSVGLVFTVAGLIDAVPSKGRHVGWPMLLATGLCALGVHCLA